MISLSIRPARWSAAALTLAATVTLSPTVLVAQRGVLGPSNVTVAAEGTAAKVVWTGVKSTGVVTYRVLRGIDAAKPGLDITKPIATLSILDAKVEPGVTYFYQVIAVYANGTAGASAPVAFTLASAAVRPATAPTAPELATKRAAPPPVAAAAVTAAPVAAPAAQQLKMELSGRMIPMTMSAVMAARENMVTKFDAPTKCNPAQVVAGPSPSAFTLYTSEPGGPRFGWPLVPGAVAYVVERAVDGTNTWSTAATTCGRPDAIRSDATIAVVHDFSGGVVAGTNYVYKVKAFGASGQMGWNTTRWTAPSAPGFQWLPETIVGSTVRLKFRTQGSSYSYVKNADKWLVTAPNGQTWTGEVSHPGAGSNHIDSVSVLGLSVGTYTFTLTAQWIQYEDPSMPRVTASSSVQKSITISY